MNGSRRVVLVTMLAVLALGATASTAVAVSPHWVVAGKALAPGATEAIAESNTVTEVFAIKTPKWGLECTSMKLSGSFIEGENIRKDNVLNPESCNAIGHPSCKPGLKMNPLTSTLEGTAGSYKLNFKPTSGTTVATVTLSGAACGELGKLTVTGTMACNYPGVETEQQNHVLEFSLTSGTVLETGGEKVTLTGQDEFWLSSNKVWGVA